MKIVMLGSQAPPLRRVVALVAALALAVPLAGCEPRAGRDRTGSTSQLPSGGLAATDPADPAAAAEALDQLDDLLGEVDDAIADADGVATTDAD